MKRLLIFGFLAIIISLGCEKSPKEVEVTYLITGLEDEYKVTYIDEKENSVELQVDPLNEDAEWTYSFMANSGDVLYLYLEYYNEDINPVKFKLRILIEGKIFKESVGYDKEDWVNGQHVYYVKRNGTIPFELNNIN